MDFPDRTFVVDAAADQMAPGGRRRWPLAAKLAVAAVVGYGLLVGGLWAGQRHLIYFSQPAHSAARAKLLPTGSDIVLFTDDGLELTAWWVTPTAADRGQAVLFAPGNGGNRGGRTFFAQELADRGFHVLLLEYRGYGGNPGTPSADGLHLDALAAVNAMADKGFSPENIIYFGESLGTGVVSRLATEVPPAAIVLRSPFTTLAEVAARQFRIVPTGLINAILRDHFEVVAAISNSDVPVTVIYGSADITVPTALSSEVASLAGNLFERVVIEGAGHNDAVWASGAIADAVVRIASAAAVSARP